MIRRCCLLILYLWMTIALTSCWDRRELNDIAIAVGMGLDISDKGDTEDKKVQVTIQIVNPREVASNKGGSGYSPPITVYSATEATTVEAFRKLTTIAPREIFLSQLRILVIGEQLAREGIADILDGVARHHEARSDFYIIVARETTAEHVLKILTPIEKIPTNKMFTMLEMSEKIWAPTVNVQMDGLIENISNPTKNAVLTGIRIVGDEEVGSSLKNLETSKPLASLQYSGIAVFKNDKLIDWLSEEESKGYNYIMGNVNTSVGHIPCPDGGIIALDIIRSKSSVKGKIVSGKPEIHIGLFLEENVSEVQCKIDLTEEETIQKLEKLAEKGLKRIMNSAIKKAQKDKTDIFGFGEAIEDASPKSWRMLKKDWNEEFAELEVSFHVDVKIRRVGTIINSLQEREE